MQIGVDRALHEGANGNALVGGFTAHYGKANTGVRSFFGDGRIDTDAVGLGATLTWYSPDGFYADAPARFSWFSSDRSEEHTSELQSLMRISYAVFCFKHSTSSFSSLSFLLFYSILTFFPFSFLLFSFF